MTEPTHDSGADVAVVEEATGSTALGAVTAEVFAGEAHLGGDPAATCDVDAAPETHYPNEVELRVGVDGLEVLVGFDEATARQLRDVLDSAVGCDRERFYAMVANLDGEPNLMVSAEAAREVGFEIGDADLETVVDGDRLIIQRTAEEGRDDE